MDRALGQGKRGIVCGALNLTYRPSDQKPCDRMLWIDGGGYLRALLPAGMALEWQRAKGVERSGNAAGTPPQPLAGVPRIDAATEHRLSPVIFGPFPDWSRQWVPVKEVLQ